jgi:hypothetical protein
MMLSDLPDKYDKPIKIGSTIYLIRKISGHVTETELVEINDRGVKVKFDNRHQYMLDLQNNQVLAVDATMRHKEEMKAWWQVWIPHLECLKALCSSKKKETKNNRRFGK